MSSSIIAITGMPGSRKSIFAEELSKLGYENIMMSEFIKQRLKKKNLSFIQNNYWKESILIRKEYGNDALAMFAWQKLSRKKEFNAIIDGLRSLQELSYLKQRADHLLLVAIQASPNIRHSRLIKSTNQFYKKDKNRIINLEAHELNLGLGYIIALSDIIIPINNVNIPDDFFIKQAKFIDNLFKEMKKKYDKSKENWFGRDYYKALSELIKTSK